jgi:predicted thioesterase
MVGTEVTIQARLDVVDRRKLYLIARIVLADGTNAVEAKALFITRKDFDSQG